MQTYSSVTWLTYCARMYTTTCLDTVRANMHTQRVSLSSLTDRPANLLPGLVLAFSPIKISPEMASFSPDHKLKNEIQIG